MKLLETERLTLRDITLDDAEFLVGLMNQPSWIRFIGDRGVRTAEEARTYLTNGPLAMHAKYGFGLYVTELKNTGVPIGICCLIKRDALPDVDIGYGFLPEYWGKGYAFESASALFEYAKKTLGMTRIVAITNSDNESSIKLLEKMGLHYEKMVRMSESEPEIKLFAWEV